ncbi:hypothetical protein HUX88_25030 [Duganella sp. BJB1802]|uniref:hypothetical protein n=1 Tax=Duganella sp. BJB1802 TaxID=2744575 RepID=UPI0015938833|nr:hypothetical protein [Duganella sp. BJB1802]NVD73771.1 hypothetical protein [Duganella sp. BJB1802]
MNRTALLRQYQTEYQMLLRALKLLLEAVALSELQDAQPRQPLQALGADLMEMYAALSGRLRVQVSRGELEIDLVLGAQIRESCDAIQDLVGRLTRGDPQEHAVAAQSSLMHRYSALLFERCCVRAMACDPV